MFEPGQAWLSSAADTASAGKPANPFDSEPVARRYAAGRVYYHRTALALAAEQLGTGTVDLALDIGCGTGLSSRAVHELARRVLAVDVSLPMLHAAEPLEGVDYVAAAAERIPVQDATVDVATIGVAFHWFDQLRAFPELSRVLRAGGALIVYSDFFHGHLIDQPGFAEWLKNTYLPSYPKPARHAYFDPEQARAAGFTEPRYAETQILVPLTAGQLADYLLSQTNAAVAIESGRVSSGELRDHIIDQTARFFPNDHPTDAAFGIRVWSAVRHHGVP